MIEEKRIINEVRRLHDLPEKVTDKEIVENSKGTTTWAWAKLNLALADLGKAFKDALPFKF